MQLNYLRLRDFNGLRSLLSFLQREAIRDPNVARFLPSGEDVVKAQTVDIAFFCFLVFFFLIS